MRSQRLWIWLVLFVVPACTIGHPWPKEPVSSLSLAELLAHSEQAYQADGPVAEVSRSLELAAQALDRDPDNTRAALLVARATFWLVEYAGADEDQREQWAEQGAKAAKITLIDNENCGVCHFLRGAHLGILLSLAYVPDLTKIPALYHHFAMAAEMAPDFDDGAPLRAQGMLLIRAPSWPQGMGDPETGLDFLQRACDEFPACPAGPLYLAEAQLALGQPDEAQKTVLEAQDRLFSGAWGARGVAWSKMLAELHRKLADVES